MLKRSLPIFYALILLTNSINLSASQSPAAAVRATASKSAAVVTAARDGSLKASGSFRGLVLSENGKEIQDALNNSTMDSEAFQSFLSDLVREKDQKDTLAFLKEFVNIVKQCFKMKLDPLALEKISAGCVRLRARFTEPDFENLDRELHQILKGFNFGSIFDAQQVSSVSSLHDLFKDLQKVQEAKQASVSTDATPGLVSPNALLTMAAKLKKRSESQTTATPPSSSEEPVQPSKAVAAEENKGEVKTGSVTTATNSLMAEMAGRKPLKSVSPPATSPITPSDVTPVKFVTLKKVDRATPNSGNSPTAPAPIPPAKGPSQQKKGAPKKGTASAVKKPLGEAPAGIKQPVKGAKAAPPKDQGVPESAVTQKSTVAQSQDNGVEIKESAAPARSPAATSPAATARSSFRKSATNNEQQKTPVSQRNLALEVVKTSKDLQAFEGVLDSVFNYPDRADILAFYKELFILAKVKTFDESARAKFAAAGVRLNGYVKNEFNSFEDELCQLLKAYEAVIEKVPSLIDLYERLDRAKRVENHRKLVAAAKDDEFTDEPAPLVSDFITQEEKDQKKADLIKRIEEARLEEEARLAEKKKNKEFLAGFLGTRQAPPAAVLIAPVQAVKTSSPISGHTNSPIMRRAEASPGKAPAAHKKAVISQESAASARRAVDIERELTEKARAALKKAEGLLETAFANLRAKAQGHRDKAYSTLLLREASLRAAEEKLRLASGEEQELQPAVQKKSEPGAQIEQEQTVAAVQQAEPVNVEQERKAAQEAEQLKVQQLQAEQERRAAEAEQFNAQQLRAEQERKAAEQAEQARQAELAQAEQARQAELAKAEQLRAQQLRAEQERVATEQARQAELAKAEQLRQAQEAEQLRAQRLRAEQERKAAEEAEQARQAELTKAEQARQAELTKAEQARQAELAKAEQLRAQQLRAEQERVATEQARQAELAKAEQLRQAQEAEKAQQLQAEQQRIAAEQARQAELAKAEQLRKAEEAEKAQQLQAERQRIAAEQARQAELAKAEQLRQAQEAEQLRAQRLRAEQERKVAEEAEQARQAELTKAEQARQAELAKAEQLRAQQLRAEQERVTTEQVRQAELAKAEQLRQAEEAEKAQQLQAELAKAEQLRKTGGTKGASGQTNSTTIAEPDFNSDPKKKKGNWLATLGKYSLLPGIIGTGWLGYQAIQKWKAKNEQALLKEQTVTT